MPETNAAVLDFLATRRSVPPKLLKDPAPSREELAPLLTLAARVPDHGMLTPWRFIVLEAPALRRIADQIATLGEQHGTDPADVAKAQAVYTTSPLAVVVVSSPKPPIKIPEAEQVLSAGAVCLTLVNAALAAGWGAGWVTGWAAHDARFLPTILGLMAGETVAGIVHIGTGPAQDDRPRPDVAALTDWRAE